MITYNNGNLYMRGSVPTLFFDLTVILHEFLETIELDVGRENAEKILMYAGQFAVLGEDDDIEQKAKEIVEAMKNATRI